MAPASPDLIDRYTSTIAGYLPPRDRDAVKASIGAELRAQVAATEAHSGRPMSEEEVAALIKMRGHPYLIAQPYRTGRYLLIGPSLLPQYLRALKTSLTVVFLLVAIVTALFAAAGTAPVVLVQYLSVFGRLAFPVFLIVTIGYAVFDVVNGRMLLQQTWDPRTLSVSDAAATRRRGGSFSDAIMAGLFLIWWLAIRHYPWVVMGPGAAFLRFSDGWNAAYPAVTVCFVTALLVQVAALVRSRSAWLSKWRTTLANALSALGAGVLLGAGDLLVAAPEAPLDAHAVEWINRAIRWCIAWTLIVGAYQMVRASVRAFRGQAG